MSTCSNLVVVAIDFGTTYSGYAFSFKSDPKAVMTNTSWSKQLISMKAPTSVLLDQDRNFHAFGYEAESKYADLLEDEEGDGWALFRKFKMILYNNSDLSDKTEVSDVANATSMPVVRVFSMAIEFLKNHALKTLNAHSRLTKVVLDESDVFFVITVPAIWEDRAKRLMREAAVEAGIAGDHLGIALESECASIWCQTVPLVNPSGEEYLIKMPGTTYMVVDLGGGTADITIHETLRDGKLRELHKASGGDWGGTQVDKHFISMLTQLMGPDAMIKFGKECIPDLFDLLREFEVTKRTISNDMTGKLCIKVPASLQEIRLENKKGSSLRSAFVKTLRASAFGEQVTIKGDKMRVDAELARDMFQYSIKGLKEHMARILACPELKKIEHILFVGGFSECSVVQAAMKEEFQEKTLIFPPEGGLAVLKGAVLYGHRPNLIEIRRARFTYGIRATEDFNKDIHPANTKEVIKGKMKCTKVFRTLVEAGDEVRSGYTITEKGIPEAEDHWYKQYEMYISTGQSPLLVTDGTCKLMGKLEVKLPREGPLSDREYETSFVFGATEMMLKVKHTKSGDTYTKYFNFY